MPSIYEDRDVRLRRQREHVRRKVLCPICGETFEVFKAGVQQAKYCGPPCRKEANRRQSRVRDAARGQYSHRRGGVKGGYDPQARRAEYLSRREAILAQQKVRRAADRERRNAQRREAYRRKQERTQPQEQESGRAERGNSVAIKTVSGTGVRRVRFIEMKRDAVRDVWAGGFGAQAGGSWNRPGAPAADGADLWEFQGGAQLAVGAESDLDADPPVVSRGLAADLIRAGDAMAVSIRSLDEVSVRSLDEVSVRSLDESSLDGPEREIVRADAEELP